MVHMRKTYHVGALSTFLAGHETTHLVLPLPIQESTINTKIVSSGRRCCPSQCRPPAELTLDIAVENESQIRLTSALRNEYEARTSTPPPVDSRKPKHTVLIDRSTAQRANNQRRILLTVCKPATTTKQN